MVHSTNMLHFKSEILQFELQFVREWMYAGRTVGVLSGGEMKNPDDTFTGNDSTINMLVTLTGFAATKDHLSEILCLDVSSLESAYEIL